MISFRREKYVPAGGPDGGDGGRGGSVWAEVDPNASTLMDFRYRHNYEAKNGGDGGGKKFHGKDGEDIIIQVPPGTLIRDAETGKIIADMVLDSPKKLLAKGGNGGWGNTHFATPTRQAPNFAKNGLRGEEREIILELKLIADVGLLGFPNVGKSTLLSKVTAAKPKIANYHFTTLEPNLGIVDLRGAGSFVLADIPGLIEGASEGAGLGHEFLRHVERTRLLIHMVDVSYLEGRDPLEDYDKINAELERYNSTLAQKPQIIAANKTDVIVDEKPFQTFKAEMKKRNIPVFEISAATGKNVIELMKYTYEQLSTLPPAPVFEPEIDLDMELPAFDGKPQFTIHIDEDGVYVIEGSWIEKVGGSINFDNNESLIYFQRTLRRAGLFDALEEMGIQEGDTVRIFDLEFDYVR